jgi:hypothetical protein
MIDEVVYDATLFGGAAASKEILQEGDTPAKTIELADNAAEYVSHVTLQVLQQTGSASRVACREGCSYCCHLSVEVAAPEALAVAEHIRRHWSPERRDRLLGT